MTVFHFFNCAMLTFGPHAVYYSATPLSEYDTIGTSAKAAAVYLGTALVKLVCLATFLKESENDNFDPYQELLKVLINFIDVAGLYFALTQLTHRNISQNHKFQAVGLGWAFADSVLHRLAPLWVGARGLEFTWEYIFQGFEANANLVLNLSLAALGSLMWLRKNKPRTLIPIIYACAGVLATMPSITRGDAKHLFITILWRATTYIGIFVGPAGAPHLVSPLAIGSDIRSHLLLFEKSFGMAACKGGEL